MCVVKNSQRRHGSGVIEIGHALRKSDLDGGEVASFPIRGKGNVGKPIWKPLGNLEKWIGAAELSELAGVSIQMARKAISSRRWRSANLLVQEVQIGRGGAGGRAIKVHVESVPADLREAWSLERGIVLHEKPDTETGKMVRVPEQARQNDARFERRSDNRPLASRGDPARHPPKQGLVRAR